MRIAGNKPQQPTQGLEAKRSERTAKTAGPDLRAADSVKSSESSGDVRRTMAAEESDRAARIAEVKAQIASGGYPLDFGALAEQMVDDELGRALE